MWEFLLIDSPWWPSVLDSGLQSQRFRPEFLLRHQDPTSCFILAIKGITTKKDRTKYLQKKKKKKETKSEYQTNDKSIIIQIETKTKEQTHTNIHTHI